MIYFDIDNSDDKIMINEELSKKSIKSKNLIIIDNDIDKIKRYYSSNKNIIIYNKNKSALNNSLYYENNVYSFNYIDELGVILESVSDKEYYRKRKNIIVTLSLITFLLITIIINNTVILKVDKTKSKNTEAKQKEIVKKEPKSEPEKEFKEIKDYKKENFVFYGDSITQCYDTEHFYPDLPVVNTAHWGYLTPTLLDEVEERVLAYNPTKVFLLMGTNDLGYSDSTDEEIFENIKKVVQIIKKDRKNVKIYIQSIYPVNETIDIDAGVWHIRENGRIRNINSMLEQYCKDNKYTYIDVYSALQEEDGSIKEEYTVEGLHITYDGYKKITEVLDKYVREAY